MAVQPAAGGRPEGHRRGSSAAALLKQRPLLVCAPLICIVAGLGSIALGPDNNWDLRYYHLYAPWAYLHHRYLYDIGPAQEQSFFNPIADLLFYGLISSPLNDWPRVVAFIMGAVHGVNAVLAAAIAPAVLHPAGRFARPVLVLTAFLMGVTGAGFISLLGTTTNDLINSIFVLGALLGLIKAAQHDNSAAWHDLAWPGLLAGIGVGIKYTVAIYGPGLLALAVFVALRRRRIAGLAAFGIAGAIGLFGVAGHHMLTLWRDFGNPFFPFLNQIFQSPYFEPVSIRDARFVAQSIWQLVTYPFEWTRTTTYVVTELPFRDWRAAIAYVAMAASLAKVAVDRLRDPQAWSTTCRETRGLGLIYVFVVISYLCWAEGFGIFRYAVTLEMLSGVVTVGAVIWIFRDPRARVIAAITALVIAVVTTEQLDWGRGDFDDKYVDIEVPALPPDSLVLIATWDPVAYFIPFADPSARYIGIENNYLEIDQTNLLATEVKRLMRENDRPKFVLSVDGFDPAKLNALLAHFGKRLSGAPCLPIHSNLEVEELSLCPVAD